MTTVNYEVLSPNNAALTRCDYLMQNHMQCPTHAGLRFVDGPDNICSTPCVFHFNLLKAMDNDLSFAGPTV